LKPAPPIPKSISIRLSDAIRPRFIASWNFPALDYIPFRLLVAVFILGACFVRAYVGLWGSRVYTQDAFSILDGAWRILNGQRTHIDFYTGLGPVSYLITAAGVVIAGGNAAGLAYGQALFGCLAGLWAYLISERRLRGMPAMLLCAVVALMAIVPTTIGDSPAGITPATTYNRCGYALVALLMIEASAACRSERKRGELWGGLSTGLVVGTLLFLKVSFFMAAVFLLAALLPLREQSKERWYGMVTAFCVTVVAFACYLRFDLAAMYHDLRTVAHAKHVMVGWYLAKDIAVYAVPFLLLACLVARGAVSLWDRNAIRLAGLGVCLAGFFLLLTSWQFFSLPLDTVMAILLVERATPESAPPPGWPQPRLAVLLLGVFFAISYITSEAAGLKYAVTQKLHQIPHTSFTAPSLAGFNSTVERDYVEYVNEGCDLLNRHRQGRDSVLALNFTNPFSFALGMKPPSGGTTWLQYGTDFDEAGPPPERIFGDASLVMLPKLFSDYTLPNTVPRIYEPFLKKHYTLDAESLNWWLYKRNQAPGSGSLSAFSKASVASSR
jgi:hypothetical protein